MTRDSPHLLHLDDNYLRTAFKEKNFWFFPEWTLALVDKSPDALIQLMAAVFLLSWWLVRVVGTRGDVE